ncbi:MAG: TldD/PmbA family protein, partial [Deltaproteobacteria bacterium]|nr:TldD/PmbA family protein [Deltaproteobacteria bacterium]
MDDRTEAGLLALCERVVEMARTRGAEVAEASARQGWNLSARVRLGEPELVEEAGSRAVGLRAMVGGPGKRQVGLTYSSDVSDAGLARLVDDAVELARLAQPDEAAEPPDPSSLGKVDTPLELYDPRGGGVKAEEAIDRARRSEQAAMAYDPRITNSEGATFARVAGASAFVTSGGFRGAYRGSYQSLTV